MKLLDENDKKRLYAYGTSRFLVDKAILVEDDMILLPCRNSFLAGCYHPRTGVEFCQKVLVIPGYEKKILVVVPNFTYKYAIMLPLHLLHAKSQRQLDAAWEILIAATQKSGNVDAIKRVLDLYVKKEAYTWHHDYIKGRMLLVPRVVHRLTGHTGGRAFWANENLTFF